MSPESPHHGSDASAARPTATTTANTWLAAVARSTRTGCRVSAISIPRAREQPARPDDQDDKEGDVAGQDLPGRRQRAAKGLRKPHPHPPDQGPPQAAEPADDDG